LKLPEFNLTINKENDKYITTKRNKEILIPIINNPTELVKLGRSLEEVDKKLDNNDNNICINKCHISNKLIYYNNYHSSHYSYKHNNNIIKEKPATQCKHVATGRKQNAVKSMLTER